MTQTDLTDGAPGPDATILPASRVPTEITLPIGKARTLMRTAWLVIAALYLALFIVGLATFITHLPADLRSSDTREFLRQLGIPVNLAVVYFLVREVLAVLPLFVAGVVFYLQKSDRLIQFLVALGFIMVAPDLSAALYNLPAGWQPIGFVADAAAYLIALLVLFLFPDGRFAPPWSFWLFLSVEVVAIIERFLVWFLPGIVQSFGLDALVFLLMFGAATLVQVYRFQRVATPIQRQQTKLVIGGVAAALIIHIAGILFWGVFYPFWHVSAVIWLIAVFVVAPLLELLPGSVVAISIFFSVKRYRLWEVDLVLNRGLVIGGLTVVLGLIFLGAIYGLQFVLEGLLGSQASTFATIAATVIVVALFNPARLRIQRFVDQGVYGIRVNFRQRQKPLHAIIPPPVESGSGLRKLGPYELTALVGQGGMGEVYKGRHPTLNRNVAIKVLPRRLATDTQARARFELEARTIAALRHPNIVEVFDFGEADETYYFVMEYIVGQDLDHILRRRGRLTVSEAEPLLRDIASALDYAHAHGLVHRDVKPSNIMLHEVVTTNADLASARPILMDFGVARIIAGGTGLTGSGVTVGTFNYMAPEQIQAAKDVDARADVYSLGVMLYQMLTGELPFTGDNPAVIIFAHLERPAPDPRNVVADLPAEIAHAIQRAMEKQPAARFQTAGAFAAALRFESVRQ